MALFGKKDDLDVKIANLKEKYKEYSKMFGEQKFSLAKFEERLTRALKERVNLEVFINAESEALNEMYLLEVKPKEIKASEKENSFTKKVEQMIEEYDQRIKKYPFVNFHDDAHIEIRYLYGAIKLFYQHLYPYLESIYSPKNANSGIAKEFERFYKYFNYYCFSKDGELSKRIQDYVIKLKHYDSKETEKDMRHIFIETGQTFNELLNFITRSKSSLKENGIKIPLSDPVVKKVFKKDSIYSIEFLDFCVRWIKNFLYDFRIQEFNQ